MKTVCLYFQIHQPLRLKRYRFFNMGKDHYYLDNSANRAQMQKLAVDSYLPMNELLLRLIQKNKGKLKVSFSISGLAVEQMRSFTPNVLESFKRLADTGCVEFLAQTYSNSLASLVNEDEFTSQVERHASMVEREFGQRPTSFVNTAMIYSDAIGEMVGRMGYKCMLTEGAKHVLGWKSPNYVYAGALDQRLHLLLRNYKLSDDIAFRFGDRSWAEWPLSAEKFIGWLDSEQMAGEVVNLFMDYGALGDRQSADSGIFDFMEYFLSGVCASRTLEFATVSQAASKHQPIGILHSPHPMSWADEERDITAWLGNELQNEAFTKLYAQRDKVLELHDADTDYVWNFLQCADHFYYMATKWFSDGDVRNAANPYGSSYDAFINYMNVLSDFVIELDKRQHKPVEQQVCTA